MKSAYLLRFPDFPICKNVGISGIIGRAFPDFPNCPYTLRVYKGHFDNSGRIEKHPSLRAESTRRHSDENGPPRARRGRRLTSRPRDAEAPRREDERLATFWRCEGTVGGWGPWVIPTRPAHSFASRFFGTPEPRYPPETGRKAASIRRNHRNEPAGNGHKINRPR